jgi:capsular polysaccharide biosynthesis protein
VVVSCSESLFCKPYTHSKKIYESILSDLSIPEQNQYYNRKIYITRPNNSLRYISNESILITTLKEKGFEIIDANTLSFIQQIELFSQASILIGVHGAGLTNMIFRKQGKLKVIEIFSPYQGYNPFHYTMMAKMFNFDYRYINGIPSKEIQHGGFCININELENKLD